MGTHLKPHPYTGVPYTHPHVYPCESIPSQRGSLYPSPKRLLIFKMRLLIWFHSEWETRVNKCIPVRKFHVCQAAWGKLFPLLPLSQSQIQPWTSSITLRISCSINQGVTWLRFSSRHQSNTGRMPMGLCCYAVCMPCLRSTFYKSKLKNRSCLL